MLATAGASDGRWRCCRLALRAAARPAAAEPARGVERAPRRSRRPRHGARSRGGAAAADFELTPAAPRRGRDRAASGRAGSGPFGLVWKQISEAPKRVVPITPNVRRGEGRGDPPLRPRRRLRPARRSWRPARARNSTPCASSRAGMDRRTIDWKQSARHGEAAGQGVPHRAQPPGDLRHRYRPADVRAAAGRARASTGRSTPPCCMAFVSLKLGDRVGFFGFDVAAAPVLRRARPAPHAFPLLQRLAAAARLLDRGDQLHPGLTQLARRWSGAR